jgi:response regulator RpfG family c-di-GMP phosphodiesterase
MTKAKVLVLDDEPGFLDLARAVLEDCGVEVKTASHPEDAIRLVETEKSLSIVWSSQEFRDSEITGRVFLKKCREISPLASRILCSVSMEKGEMVALVRAEEITSYVLKPCPIDSILSATAIGIESRKINLIASQLDTLNFESAEDMDLSLSALNTIGKEVGWKQNAPKAPQFVFKHREVELDRLLLDIQTVKNKIPVPTARQALLEARERQGAGRGEILIKIKQVQNHLAQMDAFLSESRSFLRQSEERVGRANIGIAVADEAIKRRLKD